MKFTGFSKNDFDTFTIDGLEERMEAIQTRIQPKFKEIGQELTDSLSSKLGNEMYLHIAKHARRTVNPPKDTWMAIAGNKRGYKQHPHFQLGLFDDHVFIWLAYIYELPNKSSYAKVFLENIERFSTEIPGDFVVSMDHMKKESFPIAEVDLQKALERFRDVKKAEFLIGRHIDANDPILQDGPKFAELVENTYETLLPFYKLSN
jgi:uncharacterized protein YktB (UPF0637 family)